MDQSHSKFKVFIFGVVHNLSFGDVALQVSEFVRQNNVSAKSIGVEYLEKQKTGVLSLGYAEGQGTTPVTLKAASLGKLGWYPNEIENALEAAAANLTNVICHEFFVDDEGSYTAVFLQAAS